jgi:ATP-dependent phosphoenolpyruvate carboxykinase
VGFHEGSLRLWRNVPVAQLYEDAVKLEGAVISSSGALINFSGKKTGRSPKDKRCVKRAGLRSANEKADLKLQDRTGREIQGRYLGTCFPAL